MQAPFSLGAIRAICCLGGPERGCTVVDGLGMLVNQGVIGIQCWTGIDPDPVVLSGHGFHTSIPCPDQASVSICGNAFVSLSQR